MTVKLRKDSQIPAYMAYPRFLLTMDISETAKLVYVLLLLREDERKLEPPAQKRPVRHQPEPQKKPPKWDYERQCQEPGKSRKIR